MTRFDDTAALVHRIQCFMMADFARDIAIRAQRHGVVQFASTRAGAAAHHMHRRIRRAISADSRMQLLLGSRAEHAERHAFLQLSRTDKALTADVLCAP